MGVDLKILGEFGLNDGILALEPARKCVAHCTWCHVELNRKAAKWDGKSRNLDVPDTWIRHVNRAFGPSHDPTSFLEWALRNKLPLTWATGVEPFQDVAQSLATFDIVDRLDLALFLQTRATHWRDVWPAVEQRASAGQIALYVSIPSDRDASIKRFEPGTPKLKDRWQLVDAAVKAGIPTMLAVAPYHPDWCGDMPKLVGSAIARGVKAVFFDPLHLTSRQLEASGDRAALEPLAASSWSDRTVGEAQAAKALCVAAGVPWQTVSWMAPIHRLECSGDFGWAGYRDSTPFPYFDERIFAPLHAMTEADDAPPVLVTWDDALAAMESGSTPITQPFSWSSFGHELIAAKNLPVAWRESLKPTATLAAYLRAYWNNPRGCGSGFVWRHTFVRLAVREDGTPHLSPSGDAMMIFDPNYAPKALKRVVADPSTFRTMRG